VNLRQLLYATLLLLIQILLSTPLPARAEVYESFAGFQMDNQQQYLAYGGLRATLSRPNWPVEPFLQVFAFRQRFFFHSEGQLLEGQLTQISPAVGIIKSIGGLTLQASVGPSFLQNREDTVGTDEEGNLIRGRETTNDVGYAFSGYGSYSTDNETFEGLISYTNLSDFFFGRLRWLHLAFETEGGTPLNLGLELVAQGNADFKETNAGGLVGTELWKLSILLKGGYQNNSTFHSGGYGGIELYVRF
jgi:hypothetical protein